MPALGKCRPLTALSSCTCLVPTQVKLWPENIWLQTPLSPIQKNRQWFLNRIKTTVSEEGSLSTVSWKSFLLTIGYLSPSSFYLYDLTFGNASMCTGSPILLKLILNPNLFSCMHVCRCVMHVCKSKQKQTNKQKPTCNLPESVLPFSCGFQGLSACHQAVAESLYSLSHLVSA